MVILKGPFEVVVGLIYGVVLGMLCWVLPVPSQHNAPVLRFVVLLAAGVLSLFGSPLVSKWSLIHCLSLHLCCKVSLCIVLKISCIVLSIKNSYIARKGLTETN